ncbi:MAG: glycosyltransferase family 2 protein [Bacteroidota bacterium]
MLDLSIIIVNYNVKHFLEQCLRSVLKASEQLSVEIFVVDNNSVDGSQQMVKEKFEEQVILIENKDNPGFSKANNQAIEQAKGAYVLLLNPDTIVEEETFLKCKAFMDQHPEGGALGVKMIDGQGKFLPESKRALPTPWVSFYKIFGLASLFPKHKKFAKYHLGYLDKEENHEIEILSGAFMWMRKSALDKIGYLDESFFMYGEDIDLSYRFILEGYKNYYLSETQIVHYKGESTKKGSLNYVRVFYQAMIIFARKHFGGSQKRLFISSIKVAVYLRAFMAVVFRLYQRLAFPLVEGLMIYSAMFGVKLYWEHYVKFLEGGKDYYPEIFATLYMPIYTLVFISFLWLAGAYKKPFQIRPLILGPFWGFIAIATATYMFSAILNFSRAIVGLSSIFAMLIAISNRGILNLKEKGSFFFTEEKQKRVLIAGKAVGIRRVSSLIKGELDYPVTIIGAVSDRVEDTQATEILGSFHQLTEILGFYQIDEIIFCNEDMPTQQILDLMSEIRGDISYKILPPKADYIVGPQVILNSRYSQQIHYRLQNKDEQFRKRSFDMISSFLLLISFPFLFWLYEKPLAAWKKLLAVLLYEYHIVGYIHHGNNDLPDLKPGLLNMLHQARSGSAPANMNTKGLDRYYAQSYRWDMDLAILVKAWRRIGNASTS